MVDLRSLVLISACGILGLAANQPATFYEVVSLLGGMLITAAYYLLRKAEKRKTVRVFWHKLTCQIRPVTLLVFLGLSLLLSIPLLKYNYDIAYNTRGHNSLELFNQSNVAMLWGAFALLLPLFALQWAFVVRRSDRATLFIQISGVLGLLLGSALTVTDVNQYKGFYFLSIVLSISALFALRCLRECKKRNWRLLGNWIAFILFLLLSSRMLYVEHYLINRPSLDKYGGFGYDGNHIVHMNDVADRFDAYYWIRNNTPSDSVIVIPLDTFIFSNVLMGTSTLCKEITV